jgi:cytochrome b6-f complex iron-sulfur subunit
MVLINIKKIFIMTRKDFFARVGFGAAAVLIPSCIGGIVTSCEKEGSPTPAPTNVDFTLDVSTGQLATNGGFVQINGLVVARTTTGTFSAVSASCPHQGTDVNYNSTSNNFICPNHGAKFNSVGTVTQGPASSSLRKYNTSLTGNSLRVYS